MSLPTHDDIGRLQRNMETLARQVQELQVRNDISRLRLKLDAAEKGGGGGGEKRKKQSKTAKGASRKRAKRLSLHPPPGKKSITIKSPKTSAPITIGSKKSKAFRSLLKEARAARWDPARIETEWVVDAVAQSYRQGFTYWDPDVIPPEILERARRQAGAGPAKAVDPMSDTSDTEGSHFGKGDSFHQFFHVYPLDMSPRPSTSSTPFGKGMMEDMAIAQRLCDRQVRFARDTDFSTRTPDGKIESHPFKIYMEYTCIMERKTMTDTDGSHYAAEKRPFELSSVNVEEQPVRQGSHADPPIGMGGAGMQVIRFPGAIPGAVGQCLAAIMQAFNNIKQQGSGWVWSESVRMTIHANRVFPKLPAGGHAAEKRILEATQAPPIADAMDVEPPPPVDEYAGAYLPLPNWLRSGGFAPYIFNPRPYTYKKADDELCFSWCILRAQNPSGVRQRPGEPAIVPGMERRSPRYRRKKKSATHGDVEQSPFYPYGNVADLAEGVSQGILSHVRLPEGVEYPVPLKTEVLQKIEDLNGFSFSIFKIGPKELMPYYCSTRQGKDRPHYRLGLLQSTVPQKARESAFGMFDPQHFNFHFVLILDLVAIEGRSQPNQKYGREGRASDSSMPESGTLICDNCMCRFSARSKKNTYEEHIAACIHNQATRLKLPKPGRNVLNFDKFRYTQIQPFMICADIEAINQPRDQCDGMVSDSLTITTDHIPVSWAYQIVIAPQYHHLFADRPGTGGRPFREMRSYAGKDCMEVFWMRLREDTDVMHAIVTGIDGDVAPNYDPDSEEMGNLLMHTKECCFCGQDLDPFEDCVADPAKMRVFDHDHFTGDFRGIAHSECNIRATIKKNYRVDIFFHNLSGYDIFHLLKSIGDLQTGWSEKLLADPTAEDHTGVRDATFDVLAKSTERFTTLTWGKR